MPGFGDIAKKAFFLGVGIASYAGEKAGTTLGELREQAQKLADELVARGEMTTEEARRLVDDMVNKAQQDTSASQNNAETPSEPRRIEILSDDEEPASKPEAAAAEELRKRVSELQEELRRLQQKP